MHVILRCPCGVSLKAASKYIGKKLKCPKCSTMLVVPAPPTASAANAEQAGFEVLNDPLAQPQIPTAYPQQGAPVHPQPYPHPQGQPVYGAPPVPPKKAKPKRKTSWVLLGGIVLGALLIFGGVIWAFNISENSKIKDQFSKKNQGMFNSSGGQGPVTSQQRPTGTTEQNKYDSNVTDIRGTNIAGADSALEMADLIERVEPSIVRIKVVTTEGEGVGSGFFLDAEGKIATNFHVVRDATSVTVTTADGKKAEAIGFLVADPKKDLAIIQVDPAKFEIKPMPIAVSVPRKGDSVAAFGAPQGFGFSATKGIISSTRSGEEIRSTLLELNQQDVYGQLGYAQRMDWLQTTAAISGGNSGGPLVNMSGEMVGINTWTHPGGQNLNFASSLVELEKMFGVRDGKLYSFENMPYTTRAAAVGIKSK